MLSFKYGPIRQRRMVSGFTEGTGGRFGGMVPPRRWRVRANRGADMMPDICSEGEPRPDDICECGHRWYEHLNNGLTWAQTYECCEQCLCMNFQSPEPMIADTELSG